MSYNLLLSLFMSVHKFPRCTQLEHFKLDFISLFENFVSGIVNNITCKAHHLFFCHISEINIKGVLVTFTGE